jgi:hypothetical protein
MRVLVLTAAERLPDLSSFYRALGERLDLDIRRLDKDEQRNLARTLASIDFSAYSRVLLDLPFRPIHRHWRLLRKLPGLLVYEEDACQNYLRQSRWHGAFSRFYRRLHGARVVVTGAGVAQRLRDEGFDAHWLAKGYDPEQVYFEPVERDIELGFVGRTASRVYAGRQALLAELAQRTALQMLRTDPGTAYRGTLNRIRFFVSADVGLGEYMAKNFEAMACNCVLLAWRQGGEEEQLELEHGRHLLLYSSLDELCEHLARLRGNPAWADEIATQGRIWAETRRSYVHMADSMARLLAEASPASEASWELSWRLRLRHWTGRWLPCRRTSR